MIIPFSRLHSPANLTCGLRNCRLPNLLASLASTKMKRKCQVSGVRLSQNFVLGAGQETNWIKVSYQASSLQWLMSTNHHLAVILGKGRWKSPLADSSLQHNCNMEGFNVKPSSEEKNAAVTRSGILGDNGNNCRFCNSRIGFGSPENTNGMDFGFFNFFFIFFLCFSSTKR